MSAEGSANILKEETDEDILKLFYDIQDLKIKDSLTEEDLANKILFKDILDGELIVARAYEPLTSVLHEQLVAGALRV